MTKPRKHDMRRVDNPKIYTPYKPSKSHLFRLKGSVLPHVIGPTLVVTAISVVVVVLYNVYDIKLFIPNTFTPVLGFVVGLLLTYRTNTAYDRYWEGRRVWSTMVVAIRNLSRYIWVGVKENIPGKEADKPSIIIGKKTTINLLFGFAVATKHYLREENGYDFEDLHPYISNIKSDLPGFEPLSDQDIVEETAKDKRKDKPYHNSTHVNNHNLPLEITLYISSYISAQFDEKRIDVPITNNMISNLNLLVDCLSSFERILRTPIPLAYSVHLSQTVWIYCISLPFQLASTSWPTIVIVFFSTLILLGIERIGAEIENPFGYDYNDLDLDDFCGIIKQELNVITSKEPPDLKKWIYTKDNIPFDNHPDIDANTALTKSMDELRSYLSINKKPVSEPNTLTTAPPEIAIDVPKNNIEASV